MKKGLSLAVGLLMGGATLFGQSEDRKLAIGVHSGITDYRGEASQKWFNLNEYRGQLGLSGAYYLNSWLNVGLDASYGKYGYHDGDVLGVRANLFQAHAQLRLKFNNGKWLKEDAIIQPYVYLGTGVADFSIDGEQLIAPGTDWTGNGGLGFNVRANEWLGFNYNLNYAMTNNDHRDGRTGLENDQYMIHSIGAVFSLGKKADADGDGVSDKKDKCNNTPAGVEVDIYGCPKDTDKDGVADYLDKCPSEAGTAATGGCPDSDGDGIVDSEDACVNLAGKASANGCPDSDGDGVKDSEDVCPTVAGLKSMSGCPDSDGDGVKDSEDACPTIKGLVAMSGCPDTDNDGVSDDKDKCPTVAGVASNNGCPEIKQETKDVFEKALKGIQFETGRDVIKRSSYSILNNVATIMKENGSYKLDINGHTDSSGDDQKNMTLSQKRAESVKAYLVNKGVSADRLTAKGYGETQPKASNDTSAGRAENRRVEFVVKF